jgi:hypothetical protein
MARPAKIASNPGPGITSMMIPARMRRDPAVMLKILQAMLTRGCL